MKIVVSRRDVLWNYAGTIFSMANSFLLLPFLVAYLSGSELGLWYVYLAVGNLVMLFEFGFNPTFARNFAYCWSGASRLTKEGCVRSGSDEVNRELLAHLLSACKMIYSRLTLGALALLAIPGCIYILAVSSSLNPAEVLLSWFLYSCGTLLNLYFLYYDAMLRGIGEIACANQNKILSRLAQFATTVALLFGGAGLVGAAVGFFVNSVIFRLLSHRRFWGNTSIRRLALRDVPIDNSRTVELYGIISHNAYKDGAVQFSNFASTQASSLICSTFLGLEEAGIYSIALQFATAIGNVSLALSDSKRPMLQSSYQRGDTSALVNTFSRCTAVYVVMFIGFYIAVLFLAYPLLRVIQPSSTFSPYVFTGVSIYMFLFDWCALFASMLCNMNSLPYVRAYVLNAICAISLSTILVTQTQLGPWGLIIGYLVPLLAYNSWKWPTYTAKRLNASVLSLVTQGFTSLFRRGRQH